MLHVIRVSSPVRCRDAADRIECQCRAPRRFTKGNRVRDCYSHPSAGRNSVLLGGQKDEFPRLDLAVMLDHFEDFFAVKFL